MQLVAGVDSFRAVPCEKIDVELQAGFSFEDRNTVFLSRSRIHRRFVDDDVALFECLANGFTGRDQWAEIWSFVTVNRRRDRNDKDVRPLQVFMLAAKRQLLCLTKFFR